MKIERAHKRYGALADLGAAYLHRRKLPDHCERKIGMAPLMRPVGRVIPQPTNCEAKRVFWIFADGFAHRGPDYTARLQKRYGKIVLLHGPVPANWLNQTEIPPLISQCKTLSSRGFPSLDALKEGLLGFKHYHEPIAKPFVWKFTGPKLNIRVKKMETGSVSTVQLAA